MLSHNVILFPGVKLYCYHTCRPVSRSCMCVNCIVLPHTVNLFPGLLCVSIVLCYHTLLTYFWVFSCIELPHIVDLGSCMCVICIVLPHTIDLESCMCVNCIVQIMLDDDSKKYVVINTHRGLFCYNRLPFGISSAPGIFQCVMECLLREIPGVAVYLDNILITASSHVEHLKTLDRVFQTLKDAGLKLKRNKCVFLTEFVTYLGHRIDTQALHPVEEKIKALLEIPAPTNVRLTCSV